ncbi:MAG: LETM1-related biofilm-associated protein, partial [Bacteroidota bacterium]
MNPSSAGWIRKFINEFPKELLIDNYSSSIVFYKELKKTGFIYGVSVGAVLNEPVSELKLTKEEYTKVNLFHALWYTYFNNKNTYEPQDAIESMIDFYKSIERGKRSFFQKLSFSTSPSENLEKIISARLQETNSVLKTDATSLLTYALLYVDVLAFTYYLENPDGLKNYLDSLETTLIEHSAVALQSKKEKNKYDHLVIELVTSSSEFYPIASPDSAENYTVLEKKFLMDICCLAVWDDRELDSSELEFLRQLGERLSFSEGELEEHIQTLIQFSEEHAKEIKLFEYSHPVQQFYKQSSEMVKLLILRNKRRLLTELNESGELLVLLGQSTGRELTQEEKTKVKSQLLDIFKTVPSLTIFMLPGGALLLP